MAIHPHAPGFAAVVIMVFVPLGVVEEHGDAESAVMGADISGLGATKCCLVCPLECWSAPCSEQYDDMEGLC